MTFKFTEQGFYSITDFGNYSSLFNLTYQTIPSCGFFKINKLDELKKFFKAEGFIHVNTCYQAAGSDSSYHVSEPRYESHFQYDRKVWVGITSNGKELRVVYTMLDEKSLALYQKLSEIMGGEMDEKRHEINFLCQGSSHFYLQSVNLDPLTTDLKLNYGDDFLAVDKKLKEWFSTNKTGLVLLHGKPGTGKTSYIRYLLGVLEKKIIYVPPHLLKSISEPTLLPFMLENPDSILIIEDAEEVVASRTGANSAVSNLLNLTDGILGDSIHTQVVCTFNTKMTDLDQALLRKGRLALEHEFSELKPEFANRLLASLGKPAEATAPMSLADIYYLGSDNNHRERKGIGFSPV